MISRAIITLLTISIMVGLVLPPRCEAAAVQQSEKSTTVYVCPMHPDVRSRFPGTCPKCGMTLRAEQEPESDAAQPPAAGEATPEDMSIPDTIVFDQNGNRLRFYSDLVKGKTVAIEFIFTTCTTICPPLTATLRKVQQELGGRVGRDIDLISITVDPANDTPERLKEFSGRFKAGPGWWFVTGSQGDIAGLLKALGGYVEDPVQHSPMILIGNDPARYWTRTYGLAPESKLVELINQAAAKGPRAGASSPPRTPAEAAAHYFPDLPLLTQDNQSVRFYSDLVASKVVLIDFMFTTCTGICPSMTANLVKVQQRLSDHVGREVNIISITVDPDTDTPDALKKYAELYKVREPGWYFLTGAKKNVDLVLYKLGGYVEDKNDHSTFIIIGNPDTGRWMKMFAMARPEQIAAAVLNMIPDSPSTPVAPAPPSHQ